MQTEGHEWKVRQCAFTGQILAEDAGHDLRSGGNPR